MQIERGQAYRPRIRRLEDRVLLNATPEAAVVDLPAEELINDDFAFAVTFDNTASPSDPLGTGYGPFVDVTVEPGVEINSVTYLGTTVTSQTVGTWNGSNWVDGSGNVVSAHPFGGNMALPLGTEIGQTWVNVLAPFGSYGPDQPVIRLDFNATLAQSPNGVDPGAVPGDPIDITARGGFRFGIDELNNPSTDPPIQQGSTSTDAITPIVMRLEKAVQLAEGETAQGPNFPFTYTISIDVATNITVTDVDDPKTLIDVLGRVHPTFFVAVPMLWYKIRARVETLTAEQTGPAGALARWALAAGKKKAGATLSGGRLGLLDEAAAASADALVLSKIRARLGMDQLSAAVSGAAPIDVSVLEFMLAIGVPVSEAWGMSETSAVTTVNPRDRLKLGTVGKAIPGTQIKLATDGEILVRGCGVMRGYHRDPGRTAEILDADGWIHTGDVGSLDADGYLRIVDRKKELIINSGGKNMSPSNIEGALKAASPLIGAVAAIGDNRPHIAALITLDPDAAADFASRHGFGGATVDEMVGYEATQQAVSDAVASANSRLSRVEQIRSWKVLPQYWIPGGDELTPTLKLRRAPIAEKYAAQIDALYTR